MTNERGRWMGIDSMISRWFLLIASVVIIGAAVPAPADAAQQIQCGDTIDFNLTLRKDLTGCQNSGLIVGANDITINLNGHLIAGNGLDNGGNDAGIDNSGGFTGVTITGTRDKPGIIRRFEQGVLVQGAGTTSNLVRFLTTNRNTDGVHIESNGNTVRRVRAVANTDDGIGISGGDSNTIERSTVLENADDGIELIDPLADPPQSNQVLDNVARGNANEGIHLDGANSNTVSRNNASANGRDNEQDGIDLDDSDSNTIEFNVTNGNGEDGLDLGASNNNTFRSNKSKRNREDGLDLGSGDGNTFETNKFLENRKDGVEQDSGDSNTYDENIANDNGDDGIDVQGTNTVITENEVKGNGHRIEDDQGLGIDAVGDTSVTGSGNIAVRNDDPAQCDPSSLCA